MQVLLVGHFAGVLSGDTMHFQVFGVGHYAGVFSCT